MLDISGIVESIRDAFTGNRRTAVAVAAILVVMTISAVVIVAVAAGAGAGKETGTAAELPLSPDQPLLVPLSPALPGGYVYSRSRDGKWTEADAEQWFTPPAQNALDELSAANDRIVTEITGAAP